MIKYINCKLIVSLLLVFGSFQMQAQNNWHGADALGNFSFCNNWFGDACPGTWNSATDLNIQFKNSPFQTTMYLDYGTWKDINNLIYFSTYNPSVTQFDSDTTLGIQNGLNFYGKIENQSPNSQVFNLPFHGKNGAFIEIDPTNAGLTFNRPIYNFGNKPFYVYGPNAKKLTLNDYPEGNSSVGLFIKQYSIVEVNYNNASSLSGGYFVEQGELWVEALGVIQGGIQVGNATANVNKLYISNPAIATTVANPITVPAGSTNATIGSLNTSNTHTYSGAVNLNNNAVNFDVVSAGGTVNFTNTISGTGGIQKIGPGLARLSASNTYTGNTIVNGGTLQYGIADAIANTSNVILNSGTFSTGAGAGFSDTVGTLQLTGDTTIALGTGDHRLTFAASNGVLWAAGRRLTITGWTNSCTGAKVFVGNSNTGLNATQLAQITFQGYAPGASISPIGELIPGNIVLTSTTGTLLTANYVTLTAAFNAINGGTHTGAIIISVLNDTNEGTASAVLNNNIGVTGVLIQPAGCGPRTITGTGTAGVPTTTLPVYPLVYFNGADNVTVDGLNTNGNRLTISNTTVPLVTETNRCTILFQNDATNNTITNCTVLGSSTSAVGTAGGNIWFGALAVVTGNDNNTISNCNIGPAGGNLPSKAICFTGTPGTPNDNITIVNNNIYDFFSATSASTGIDLATIGSNNVSITNNRFYQTATRTQTTASIHSCIRIVNNAGLFTITGNTIGYGSSAGTGTYNFVGIANSIFNPITLSVGTAAASSLQNNTIAGITYNNASGSSFVNIFNAILVSTGAINIGTTNGNTIGLPTAPINFNATSGLGGIAFGITTNSVSTVNIQNNTIQSITGTGAAGAAFDFTGINITGTVASTYTVSKNTIGNAVAANSINLGVLGTSTGFSTFRGINSAALGAVTIGANGFPNLIQNITLNANAANAFIGISNTGANTSTNIRYNNIRGIRFASTANNNFFRGILVSPLGTTSNTITYNTIDDMIGSGTGTGSLVRGIEVGGSGNATINNNNISNISASTTNIGSGTTTPIVGIYYGSTGAGSTIIGNTISGINATTAGAINVSVAAIVTGTSGGGTIAKNRIYGLTNLKSGATANTIGFVPNGGNWTFANNMISITNNNTVRAIGVFDAGAAGARNYFYNSIYIGGTHAGTQVSNAFQFNNAGTGTADIKNNIFVMARTSGAKNYAFANTGANFTGLTTNYNVLNCTVASTIGLTNATDRDFAAWKTASGGDTNSYSGIVVSFIDTATAELHLTPSCTDIESGGTPVAILDDYDAVARNATTPDIGADEFAGTRPADITLTPNSPLCLGSSITLNATSTDLTYVYTWSPATGLSATTGASVIANPIVTTTYTVTGTSTASCVKLKEVMITVNPLPTPIAVSPPSVTLCPNTIQAFTAAPSSGTAIVGTANAIAATVNNTPYRQASSTNLKIQYLMTKAELNAAGFYGGNITALAFNVTVVGTNVMPVYNISLAHTNASALTTNYIATGLTQVYTGVNILPVLGLNTHTFSTAFAWDGTSNIVVNICHTGTGNGGNPFSQVTLCTPATLSTNSETNIACNALTGVTNIYKPVITLTYVNPITWSPATELYTDAAATIPYNAATYPNLATVYTKPTVPRVYTASSTITTTGCPSTNTGTITMSGKTWDGFTWTPPGIPTGNTSLTFTGSYTSSGNLSGCSCTVTGGNVVFNGPDALILTNGLTVTAPGTLKFNNNASLVQIDDTATNTGIITVERITQPMYRYDFTYWGSPVTLASNFTLGGVNGLSPLTLSDKYFSWIPTVSNAGGNWAYEPAATVMDPFKGYCVRAPQTFSPIAGTTATYTANFLGTPNTGNIPSPIYHGTMALALNDDKWNLIGNPYPSALDAQAFLTDPANTPIIDGTIYFWTHNSPIGIVNQYPNPFYGSFALNYNNNDYAAWNSLGSVGSRGIIAGTLGVTPNGFIASGQGFFAKSKGTAATGAPVTFKNSMRVAGSNNQFFRSSNPSTNPSRSENTTAEKSRIWLDLISNSGSFSQMLVGYLADATLDYDRMYDGVPIDESGMLLYSVIPDRKLIIQGRPMPFEVEDQVILGFKSVVQDTYSIGLDAVDGLFETQDIYIEDRQLNIIHDLKASPYTFTSGSGTFNDRFLLRYNNSSLNTGGFDANQNVVAFVFENELQVKSSTNIVAIEVFDVSGKLVQKYNPSEVTNEFITRFGFAQGVYLAKIKLDNGIEVTKKVIH